MTKLKRLLPYAAVCLSGCIFILLASSWTSPLFPYAYGYDASWYSLGGRAILAGEVPYRDYFDLKGPLLFFYEAFGQLFFKGRNGIFFIQCISISFTVYYLWKLSRLYLKIWQSVFVLAAFYYVYVSPLWGGNTAEELFMPFNMLALYYGVRYMRDAVRLNGAGAGENSCDSGPVKAEGDASEPGEDDKSFREQPILAQKKPLAENIDTDSTEAEGSTEDTDFEEDRPVIENCEWPSFIFGIGFAVMALSKVTVAATLVAVVLTIIGFLAVKRRWELILKCAVYFFLGLGTVLLPVFAYFAMNGALQDFIFCTFLFAFKRSTDYYEAFSFNWERQLLICYIAFFIGICFRRDRREDAALQALLIVTSLVVYGLLHLGTPYPYYFIGLMPLFGLLTILFLDYLNKEFIDAKVHWLGDPESPAVVLPKPSLRLVVFFLLYLVIMIFYFGDTFNKINENIYIFNDEVGKTQVEDCREINALIPPWDRDEVYNLESGMIYYEVNQLLPANKYPVNLPYFLHLHPPIKEEVLYYLSYVQPRWIISEHMDGFDDEDVKAYVFSNYEMVASNSGEELYRRRE